MAKFQDVGSNKFGFKKRRKSPKQRRAPVIKPPEECKTEGCTLISATRKDGVSLGHCQPHWSSKSSDGWARKREAVQVGDTKWAANGYIHEWDGRHWRYQQDIVAEKYLGRSLQHNERVLHLAKTTDNSEDNLLIQTVVPLRSLRAENDDGTTKS